MKISFKNLSCQTACEIFVDESFIGKVRLDIWTGQWTLHPNFKIRPRQIDDLNDKYFSSVDAGRAMAKIFSERFNNNKGDLGDYEFDLNRMSLNDILLFLKLET
jgi:hypothetical protein